MKLKIQTIFLILASISGVLFAVFVPPNEVPDEDAHFARVYDIASGNIIPSQAVILPGEFLNILEEYHIRFGKARAIDSHKYLDGLNATESLLAQPGIHVATHYSPINYLPQVVGIVIGNAFNWNTRWVFLIGRLFGLGFYICITYTILSKSLFLNHSLLVLFAMPMTVYLAASYSADGVLLALSFLYIHLIINNSFSQTKLSTKQKLIFTGLGILLALTKQISLLLILLLLAIPTIRFGSLKKKMFFMGTQFFISTCVAIWWISITSSNFSTPSESVMPGAQLAFILSNPVSLIKMFFSTLIAMTEFYSKGFIGFFGWLTTPMPDFTYILFAAALIMAIVRDMQETRHLGFQQTIIFSGAFLLYIFATVTSMYILWTPYRSAVAQGVQGRYFIAVFPLILYVLTSFKFFDIPNIINKALTTLIIGLVSCVLILGLQTIYLKFFVLCGEYYYTPTLAGGCGLPQQLQTESPDTIIGQLDRPFTQTFIAECNDLHTVSFLLAPSTGERIGYLNVLLVDETDGTVIFNKKAFVPKVVGRNWKTFYFSPLPDSKDRKYSIQISPEEHHISAAALGAITISDTYLQGELIGADFSGDLIFSYRCPYGFRYDLKNLIGR
ncbi:MAG: DUF2142 domain-containing protein [Anaerolineae bacterium]|nr:DUF2142 domain-containing protein [Anaerolineae bacterium]